MTSNYQRDLRGRFTVSTSNVPESSEGRFATMRELDITNTSAGDVRPGIERPKYSPETDDLAPGGPWPLHRRRPVLVSPDDGGNRQGALTRAAAADSGPMDPSYALCAGFTPRAAYVAPEAVRGE